GPNLEFCQLGRARERHRWSRLRLWNLRGPRSGRHQNCLAQTAIARRGRPLRLRASMGQRRVADRATRVTMSLKYRSNLWTHHRRRKPEEALDMPEGRPHGPQAPRADDSAPSIIRSGLDHLTFNQVVVGSIPTGLTSVIPGKNGHL